VPIRPHTKRSSTQCVALAIFHEMSSVVWSSTTRCWLLSSLQHFAGGMPFFWKSVT
jgi:hypothetical protein